MSAFLLACCLLAGPAATAQAHAVLQQSSIAPGSLIATLPATLTLNFSEDLAPAKSNLTVTGPDGSSALVGALQRVPDARSITTHLQSRGGGTYNVFWTSVSAQDGRVLSGAFAFAVGYVTAANDLSSVLPAPGSGALKVIKLLATITTWLLLFVALTWAGGALLEMPPGASSTRPALSGGDAWITTVAVHARVVRFRLMEILLSLLLFSLLLSSAALVVAGRVSLLGGLAGIFAGHLGLARVCSLLLVIVALLDLRRDVPRTATANQTAGYINRRRQATARAGTYLKHVPPLGRWGQLIVAMLFLLMLAVGSHAASVPGITTSSIVLEWLHSIAAAGWVGGMAYLALTVLPVLENIDLDQRAPLFLGVLRRYGLLVVASVAVMLVTGLFAAQEQLGSRANVGGNAYGYAFIIKMLLTAALLAFTANTLIRQRERVERIWTQRLRLESLAALELLGRNVRIGAALGAVVLAATSVLAADPPAAARSLPSIVAALPPLPTSAWQSVGLRGQIVHRLLFQPRNRHVLWAATNTGVWRSIDDQKTWHRAGASLRKIAVLDIMALDNGRGLLAASANGQLYRTYDAGRHWQRLGKPFGRHPLRVLTAHGKVLLAGGDDGIFRSTDDSRHWHRVSTLQGQGAATVYWFAAEGHFVAAARHSPWQIFRALPDAGTWRLLLGAPASQPVVLAIASTAGPTYRMFAGTDGGSAWTAPQSIGPWMRITGIASGSAVDALLPDGRTLGRVYLGADNGGAYVTADGGSGWSRLGLGSPRNINNLVMRPGVVRILYAATKNGVYKLSIGV